MSDVQPTTVSTRALTGKRKSKSNNGTKRQSTTTASSIRPKLNARKIIRNLVHDHLLTHLKRPKRFLSSYYSDYYRTRPIHQPAFDSSYSYRTVPLRPNYYLNGRMNNYFNNQPFIAPQHSPTMINSPIVNLNPSIHHRPNLSATNFDLATENSNAYTRSSTTRTNEYNGAMGTTDTPLSSTVVDDDEDANVQLKQECGGSIISDRYILSAAHCFENTDVQTYRVGVGSHLLKNLKIYSIQRIHLHPKYKKKEFYHDLAIVELAERLKFDEDTQPICLPSRELLKQFNLDEQYLGRKSDDTFEERSSHSSSSRSNDRHNKSTVLMVDSERSLNSVEPNTAVVVGWGSERYGTGISGTEKLHKAHLKLVKQADCNALFRKLKSSLIPMGITGSMICASGKWKRLFYSIDLSCLFFGQFFYFLNLSLFNYYC